MDLTKNAERFSDDVKLLITYPKHVYQPIRDVAIAVYNSFFDFGIEVEFEPLSNLEDLNKTACRGTYSHILSINTHDFFVKGQPFYMDHPKVTKLMAYNLEQSPIQEQNSFWASMRLNEIGYYGPYFDYIVSESKCKDQDIKNMGMRVLNLNLPYHPVLDLDVNPTLEDKEYDVMFIGCGSKRRQDLINAINEEGLKIAPAPLPQALDKGYKSSMVKRTKLCLNMHFSDMEYFEKPRIMYDYFMHKGVVISEKILFPECFQHLKDFYMAKYDNIIPMLIMILNEYNEEILKVGYAAYDKFKKVHHYEQLIPEFLNQLCEEEMKYPRRRR